MVIWYIIATVAGVVVCSILILIGLGYYYASHDAEYDWNDEEDDTKGSQT